MAVYGYHRTSTVDQHLDRGVIAIQRYCDEHKLKLIEIYTDQQTGKNFNRPDYQFMRKRLLIGDMLIISELDRLGRNKEDTLKELRYFKETGVRVMILEIPTTLVDYSSMDNSMASMIMQTINNMLIEMYAVFAQAEMEKREKRQREGIEEKKRRGEWSDYGRPASIPFELFCEQYKLVVAGQVKPFTCMKKLGMTKSTFYRYKKVFDERYRNEIRE